MISQKAFNKLKYKKFIFDKNKRYTYNNNFHFWHIVTLSPWPFMLSMFLASVPLGMVCYMQGYVHGLSLLYLGMITTSVILYFWFRDIILESTYEGYHTKQVQKNIYISFSWFIFSEVMLFVAFFWAFFHSSLFPTVELNMSWPPVGFKDLIIAPLDIPLVNTLLLLLSGATLTFAHYCLKEYYIRFSLLALIWTILIATLFIFFQGFEYYNSAFDISDSVYGSTFFLCTGLHGFHVIVGNTALIITLFRVYFGHFSRGHHIGFELAAWYWHFVDVVWLFLYIIIYCWGSNMVGPIISDMDGKFTYLIYYWC
jgi:cytochrome c oxidase subunit 3